MVSQKVFKTLLSLIVGFVVTVVVAGASCLWSFRTSLEVLPDDEAAKKYECVADRLDWGDFSLMKESFDGVKCEVVHGFGFAHTRFTWQKIHRRPEGAGIQWSEGTSGMATEYGWPLRCFIGVDLEFVDQKGSGPQSSDSRFSVFGPRLEEMMRKSQAMTLSLLVDALVFAMSFRLSLGLPKRLRMIYRIKQGHCGVCGYPRGASPKCSECGSELPTQAAIGEPR